MRTKRGTQPLGAGGWTGPVDLPGTASGADGETQSADGTVTRSWWTIVFRGGWGRVMTGCLAGLALALGPWRAEGAAGGAGGAGDGARRPRTELGERGFAALTAGRWDEARMAFRRRLAEAVRADDAVGQAEAWFYLGLVDQQAADAAEGVDADRRRGLLQTAQAGYRRALALKPEAAGVWNNLARVQVALGQTNDALGSLNRAVAMKDARQGFYAQNYADLLLATGQWREACRHYAWLAGEQPRNTAVWERMVEACLEHDRDLLVWYLWDLADRGQVSQVQDIALTVIHRGPWPPALKDELLGLGAFCLSRKQETRDEFLASPAAAAWRALESDRDVGQGAREILELYQGNTRVGDYRWWPPRGPSGREAARGVWPFEAFLGLVRSLAERAAAQGDSALQENFLLLAVGVKSGAPDPEALLQMANLYGERGERAKIDALMERYEVDIFRAKGDAYTAAQKERIYRYHMALGVIYSQMDRFTAPSRVQSAEFQLRQALATADHLNESAEREGRAPIVVPARLVDLLAQGLEKDRRPEEAVKVRIERAENYLRWNQRGPAAQVLQPLKTDRLPAPMDDRMRRRMLQAEDVLKQPVAPTPGLRPAAAGDLRVRVTPEANRVTGMKGRQALSEPERTALEDAVNRWVPQAAAQAGVRGTRGGGGAPDGAGLPPEIQEIQVSGRRGTVLLRRGTNLVQVPFTVPAGTTNLPSTLRWVRP